MKGHDLLELGQSLSLARQQGWIKIETRQCCIDPSDGLKGGEVGSYSMFKVWLWGWCTVIQLSMSKSPLCLEELLTGRISAHCQLREDSAH